MKTLKALIIGQAFAILFGNCAFAQLDESILVNGQEVFLHKDSSLVFRSLLVRNTQGTTYLTWGVENLKCDGSFIIYRSSDGQNFEIIDVLRSVRPVNNTLMVYSYEDNKPREYGQAFYKIMHLGTDNSFFISEQVRTKSPALSFIHNRK